MIVLNVKHRWKRSLLVFIWTDSVDHRRDGQHDPRPWNLLANRCYCFLQTDQIRIDRNIVDAEKDVFAHKIRLPTKGPCNRSSKGS